MIFMLIKLIKSKIDVFVFKRKWRNKNVHNQTAAADLFNDRVVSVGKCTYGKLHVLTYDNVSKLVIGNYCSIGPEVWFIVSADHYSNTISTFPYRVMVLNEPIEGVSKGDIIVDDDVWIGHGVIILSGVHIGQGAIIAAGAVVTCDVLPYMIVGGVPAKIIKKRFSDEVINFMKTLDYNKLDKSMIKEHINDLYLDVNGMKPEDVRDLYKWFPKKE